ncbi:MAG: slipin family protein [Acidobacteriota bacterium]
MYRRFRVRALERGFLFDRGDFRRVLGPGIYWLFDPFRRLRMDVASVRDALVRHADLEVLVKAGAFDTDGTVLDLKDHERALVWVDGRYRGILGPGLHAAWTAFHDVKAEIVDVRAVRFEHEALARILAAVGHDTFLHAVVVEPGQTKLVLVDGEHRFTLGPGAHAFWKGAGELKVVKVELREQVLDVAGQEIMTADKVTLRLNAVVTYKVVDPLKSVVVVEDARQALYREAQLALRATIGTRDLDVLLGEKDPVARELETAVRTEATAFGLHVLHFGIRDVILPGEMKELMNKVTEARKAAEATLITRREETAAMRSQANTAKLLEGNAALMRLRELEVLEKVAQKANLTVVVGEQGLADRVVKLL